MRLSNLRAFIPTRNATAFDPSGGKFRLSGHDPIYDVHGCGGTLSVDLPDIVTRLASTPITARGERLTFSVTSVEAGQTVILRRPGRPDLKETFAEQGILLDGAGQGELDECSQPQKWQSHHRTRCRLRPSRILR